MLAERNAPIRYIWSRCVSPGTVIIPEAVYQELTDPEFPVSGATEVQTFDWIKTGICSDRTLVEALCNELDRWRCRSDRFDSGT